MAKNSIVTPYDDAGFPAAAATVASLSASGGVQVVKAGPGRLLKVIVTTATTVAACTVYDNATTNSGTQLLVIPAATAAGTVYDVNLPAVNGITVNGGASAGQLAVGYA